MKNKALPHRARARERFNLLLSVPHSSFRHLMGVLENALSEEMDLPASSSSSRRNSLGDGIRPRRAQPRAQEKNKVIAAAVGATLTSLTSKSHHDYHQSQKLVCGGEASLSTFC